jgi:hypothetical protein
MSVATQIIKNIKGEFVSAQTVKEATQKDYNKSAWEKTVDRYSGYDDCRFFKTPGNIYEYDYLVVYIADGIRFLGEVSYSSSMTSGGFVFGFFTEGNKDPKMLELVKLYPELEGMDQDSLTILGFGDAGRIATTDQARVEMRRETNKLSTRFFTKKF